MKIKALITALVLGSSSVAMAQPLTINASARVSWGVGSSGPVVRDHRDARPIVVNDRLRNLPRFQEALYPNNNRLGGDASTYVGPRPAPMMHHGNGYDSYRPSWLAITEPTRIDRGRQFIAVGTDLGRFRQLRLRNTVGWSMITQIKIDFGNNVIQTVDLNQRLDRYNPVIDIDLDGYARSINRVIVYGSTANGSAYQLLAL